jgi:hypothetical protein
MPGTQHPPLETGAHQADFELAEPQIMSCRSRFPAGALIIQASVGPILYLTLRSWPEARRKATWQGGGWTLCYVGLL